MVAGLTSGPAALAGLVDRPGPAVGEPAPHPHNPGMDIISDNPDHGFQFPGPFELSAMGTADKAWTRSSSGRYVSVRIAFRANSREEYDRAHEALRAHPEVKWTL